MRARGGPAEPEEEDVRRRITWLLGARLGLSVVSFALALTLVGAGREGAEQAERGLYGTLAFAFLSTAVYAWALPRVTRLARLGALQLATDLAIVTSLVAFSGGADSVFSFLYVPITVYGAILFDRRGAWAAAGASSLGHGVALLGAEALGLAGPLRAPAAPAMVLAGWAVHSAALGLVALLSSGLSREIRLAGERLDARTMDLARLRRLHERTVESLTSGLLTLDREGRITSFNPEAQRITGCPAEEAWGRTLDELLPGASALTTGPGAPVPGGRGRRRLVVRDREGGERHLGLASSVLRDERGDASGHVVIFQDVTQVVAMERDLRRSERLAGVGQLAADIAHEIRNPLAAISGSVEMLRGGLGEGEEDQERARLMDIVLREIDRLDDLITDFLSYARPAPPKATATEVAPLVEDLAKMLGGGLAPGISLQVDVEPGLRVLADPTQLRQVLWNLLTNAQQAMEDGGELRIRAHAHGSDPQAGDAPDRNDSQGEPRGVEIVVADTGSGISPENLERIFDPFFTTKPGGTGLGLATVHRIVESHGGSLHVDSRLGAGAEFRVRLRAVDEAAEPAEAER